MVNKSFKTFSVASRVSAIVAWGVLLFILLPNDKTIKAGVITPIDFSSSHDLRIQTIGQGSGTLGGNVGVSSIFPEGSLSFHGIAFETPIGGLNAWSAGAPENAAGTQILTVPVGIYGVTQIYTLMNTLWGEQEPGALAMVRFNGADGTVHQIALEGNESIRDWLFGGYSNSIYSPLTVNAFIAQEGFINLESRLDMQFFKLPPSFHRQVLQSIQFIDAGGIGKQRLLVYGITAESVAVPEPSTLWAFAIFVLTSTAYTRRKGRNMVGLERQLPQKRLGQVVP